MIPIVKPYIPPKEELMPALEEVLYSGYIAQGEKVEQFETELSNYFETKNILTVNSGTAALHLALTLLGIGPDDEVISTPVTAEPTNTTIGLTGAKVVFADVESTTGLISASSILQRITGSTKAIVVVHYAGMVADMSEIYRISRSKGIPVIEDCAHALGASYNGKKLGYHSDFAIYSFQAIKHLTTIDGGLLIVSKSEDYSRAKKLRWFGLDKTISRADNNIREVGFKYHMNNVNATIGLCQLNHYQHNVQKYFDHGQLLDNGITNPKITIPSYHKSTIPAYWLYTLIVDDVEGFNDYMKSHGIMASQLHKRNDLHEVFKSSLELPEFYRHFTHIGCGPWLAEDIHQVIEIINNY
jgi:perosamine synthetase